MKKSIYLLALSFLFFACQHKPTDQQTGVSPTIIQQFNNKILELEDIIAETRILKLHNDTSGYIGAIKDVCIIDSFLYVLDGATSALSQFRLSNGYQIKAIHQQGAGPLEYIQPISISADRSSLYMLDLSGMAILTYDKDLNPQKKIRLTFPCLDFAKISNGFLCYNPSPTKTLGTIIWIDSEGNIRDHYQQGIPPMRIASHAKIFNKDVEGNVYITPFFSRTTYIWNEKTKKMEDFAIIDFSSLNLPNDYLQGNANPYEDHYAIPANFFKTSQAQVRSFLYQNKRYYSFAYPDKIISGSTPPRSTIPFYPQWQANNYLIGTCSSEMLQQNPDNEEIGESLLLFTLK